MRRLLATLIFLGCAASARAASADQADDLVARGIELRRAGKDDEALAAFKQALDVRSTPRARAQVALAEQALGMWVAAEADLVAALANDGDPWIVKNRSTLDGALGVIRRHLGSLDVRGPAGAQASLDGKPLGTLASGALFRVESGTHHLEVTADGHHPTTRTVEIPPGGTARETVTLVPLASATPSAPSAPPPPREPRPEDASPERSSLPIVGWSLAGAGVALLAVGGAGALAAEPKTNRYNARRAVGLCGGADESEACRSLYETAQSWRIVNYAGAIGGGVLVVGGLAMVVLAPRRSGARASAGPAWSCAPAGPGLACSGVF